MSDFKGRHFGGEVVLWAVRWYCRYPIRRHRKICTQNYVANCSSRTAAAIL